MVEENRRGWRPEGWSAFKIQSEILKTTPVGYHNDIAFIEAGADAMLKTIFGKRYSGFAIEELRKQFRKD